MQILLQFESLLRILLALVLGYFIGLERELRGQPAGTRTHAMVAVGSALFIVISQSAFDSAGVSRVASTIVTGLGFLGAGTIIKEEHDIHGLTTAAGIWSVGAVGLGIGLGEYLLGCAGAFLIWIVLISERIFHFDERLRRKYVERSEHFRK